MVNTKSALSEKFREQKSGSISVRERTGIQQPEDSFPFGKYAKFDSPEFARLLKSMWGGGWEGRRGFQFIIKKNKNNYEQAIRNGSHENCIMYMLSNVQYK